MQYFWNIYINVRKKFSSLFFLIYKNAGNVIKKYYFGSEAFLKEFLQIKRNSFNLTKIIQQTINIDGFS